MISISRPGRISRKIPTIAAAVFAVALMIAVPVLSAVDTDADFTKDEAGYSIKLDNPSDEQMANVGLNKFLPSLLPCGGIRTSSMIPS